MHQVGDQTRLYYDTRSTSHQDSYTSRLLYVQTGYEVWPLKMEALRYFETSGTTRTASWHHAPGDLNPQQCVQILHT